MPTLDVLTTKDAVDQYEFPADCCIKPTHTSGHVILRTDTQPVDTTKIKNWFDVNYYMNYREANYKTLRPKVIVEPLIFGTTNIEDYKIFCYQGIPKIIQVDFDRHTAHTRSFYDVNWSKKDFSTAYPKSEKNIAEPQNLEEMLSVAARLSAGFSLIRIDLYTNGTEIFVGELTNCSGNATDVVIPKHAEQEISLIIFGRTGIGVSRPRLKKQHD